MCSCTITQIVGKHHVSSHHCMELHVGIHTNLLSALCSVHNCCSIESHLSKHDALSLSISDTNNDIIKQTDV